MGAASAGSAGSRRNSEQKKRRGCVNKTVNRTRPHKIQQSPWAALSEKQVCARFLSAAHRVATLYFDKAQLDKINFEVRQDRDYPSVLQQCDRCDSRR